MVMQRNYEGVLAIPVNDSAQPYMRAQALASHALALWHTGEEEPAAQALDQALSLAGDNPYVGLVEASVLWLRGKPEEAEAALRRVLGARPEYGAAWMLLGDMQQYGNDLPEAERSFGEAIALGYDRFVARMKRGIVRLHMGKLEDAEKDAAELRAKVPGSYAAESLTGLIALLGGDVETALPRFENALKQQPLRPDALYFVGLSHLIQGRREPAELHLSQSVALDPTYIPARELLGLVWILDRRFAEAEELLAPVLALKPDDPLLLHLQGVALLGQGKSEEAAPLLERLATLAGEDPRAQLLAGIASLFVGNEERALSYLNAAPDLAIGQESLLRYYLENEDLDKALAVATAYRERIPDSAGPRVLLGQVHFARGDEAAAREAYQQAIALSPEDPQANLALAYMDVEAGDLDSAEKKYRRILGKYETHLPSLLAMSELARARGQAGDQEAWLRKAVSAHPDVLGPRTSLVALMLTQNRPNEAMSLLDEVDQAQRDDPRYLAARGLSEMYAGTYDGAKAQFERLVALLPESAVAHYYLSRALVRLGSLEASRAELAAALELQPDYTDARLDYVKLLATLGRFDEAQTEIAPLLAEFPGDQGLKFLSAIIAAGDRRSEDAKALLGDLMEEVPAATVLLALAGQEIESGHVDRAVRLQREWLESQPQDVPVRLALADTYLKQADTQSALATYRDVLDLDPDNVIALNNLAWFLRETSTADALAFAERAASLAPDNASVADTLAAVQLVAGDFKGAERTLENALIKARDNRSLIYRKAVLLDSTGKQDEARGLLESLLSDEASFPQRQHAQALLDSMPEEEESR
jgi:putative PEP-CTERM system TPR-repeat lipoprotein